MGAEAGKKRKRNSGESVEKNEKGNENLLRADNGEGDKEKKRNEE